MIQHRPSQMVREVDALTRYNNWTEQWRLDDAETYEKESDITTMVAIPSNNNSKLGFFNILVMIAGPKNAPMSEMLAVVNTSRTIWNISAGASTLSSTLNFPGFQADIATNIETDPDWIICSAQQQFVPITEMIQQTKVARTPDFVDWIVVAESRTLATEHPEVAEAVMDLIHLAATS
jgi:hypothetical protein